MGSMGVAKLNLILKKGRKPAWGTSAGWECFVPTLVPTYLHPAVPTVDVAKANLQLAASLVHEVFYLLDEEVVVLHAGKVDGRKDGDEAAFSPAHLLPTFPLAFTCRQRRSPVPKCWGS